MDHFRVPNLDLFMACKYIELAAPEYDDWVYRRGSHCCQVPFTYERRSAKKSWINPTILLLLGIMVLTMLLASQKVAVRQAQGIRLRWKRTCYWTSYKLFFQQKASIGRRWPRSFINKVFQIECHLTVYGTSIVLQMLTNLLGVQRFLDWFYVQRK